MIDSPPPRPAHANTDAPHHIVASASAGHTGAARQAGRGGLAVLAAKVFFIAAGLVQQALLPRAIGLASYGALSRVLAVSNVFNNVIVASSIQGVSRTVAAAPSAPHSALRATLRIHVALALAMAAALGLLAPAIARIQHAPDIRVPLVVMAAVLFAYGVYAPLIGFFNGKGAFGRQASLDMIAATLRTVGLLAVGVWFLRYGTAAAAHFATSPGVLGATLGMAIAAALVTLLAFRWARSTSGHPSPPAGPHPAITVPTRSPIHPRTYLQLLVPVMLAQLFTNLLMQADIFLLGRALSLASAASAQTLTSASSAALLASGTEAAKATSTLTTTDAANAANEWVAVYRACQLFAFLPYQLLFSVTQILFPMLARAHAEPGAPDRVRDLVRRGSRIGTIVAGLLLVVILALPRSLLAFAYSPIVAERGGDTLRTLALGQGAFAMFGLATTVLVSLGRERNALTLTASALSLLGLVCALALPHAAFGRAQLETAAAATASALAVALVLGAMAVKRAAGSFMPARTGVRVLICLAGAFAAGGWTPTLSRSATPLAAAGVAGIYMLFMVITGEITRDDQRMVRAIFAKRGA